MRWLFIFTVDGGRWTVDGGRWTVDGGRWTVDGNMLVIKFLQKNISSKKSKEKYSRTAPR